jgi:uncharacterized membrane protein (DUF4010 family)
MGFKQGFEKRIQVPEVKAAALIALLAIAVFFFVPDKAIDPYQIFNPRKFGFLVLILACLEFFGFVLTKRIAANKASMLLGFLGGMVSSTAVTLSSARQSREKPENWRSFVTAAVSSKVAALFEVVFIVGFSAPELMKAVLAPLLSGILICLGGIFLVAKKSEHSQMNLELKSPLNWAGIFRLAFFLVAILGLISAVKFAFGDQATFTVSFLSAFFELHAVTLANATMFNQGQLQKEVAEQGVLLAVIASLLAKMVLAWALGHRKFATLVSLIFGSAIVTFSAVYFL